MICSILLLIKLTSCVCGVFEHQKALNYQAEENNNITVEWRFSSKTHISIPSLKIHCLFVPELKVFYHLDNSVEESQHEQFAGRVRCDKDALRTGSVRLHLSRVRTNDSGQYLCRMAIGFSKKVKQFSLNVTDAAPVNPPSVLRGPTQLSAEGEESVDEAKPARPKPESWGRIGLYAGLGLTAAALLALCTRRCFAFRLCLNKSPDEKGNISAAVEMSSFSEKQD